MSLKTVVGALLTAAGLGLLYVGHEKHSSVGESIGRVLGAGSSDEVKFFLLGGALCVLAGLGTLGMHRLAKGSQQK